MMEPLKFLLIPMGSAGDVHPFIWLAKLLVARGHEVLVIVQAATAEIARRAGVPHVVVGDEEEQLAVIRNPDLWHPRKAFPLIASLMPEYARQLIPVLEKHLQPGRTIMLAGSLAYGARIVGERRDVPVFTVDLQPSLMMSVDEAPVLVGWAEWLPGAPRWMRRAFFTFGNKVVHRTLKPLVGVEREQGLKKCREKNHDWWHSADGVICLYPSWFAAKAPDWPKEAVVTRFPLYDEGEIREEDPELEAFLKAGGAPVVITPGSANAHGAEFIRESINGVIKAGRRGLLATRYPEQVPRDLPTSIRHFDYVPFGRVFPRSAAVIHHGGIGTTAQCLAAGVPQLLMPMAHDQPDNAYRVRKMGVGGRLYPRQFKAHRVAEELRRLLESADVQKACAIYREKTRDQMSAEEMGEVIEEMAERALRVRQINGVGVG